MSSCCPEEYITSLTDAKTKLEAKRATIAAGASAAAVAGNAELEAAFNAEVELLDAELAATNTALAEKQAALAARPADWQAVIDDVAAQFPADTEALRMARRAAMRDVAAFKSQYEAAVAVGGSEAREAVLSLWRRTNPLMRS